MDPKEKKVKGEELNVEETQNMRKNNRKTNKRRTPLP